VREPRLRGGLSGTAAGTSVGLSFGGYRLRNKGDSRHADLVTRSSATFWACSHGLANLRTTGRFRPIDASRRSISWVRLVSDAVPD